MKQLSIIIVNYNSYKLIVDCIRTINEFTKSINFEIIIVDNNSSDESQSKLMFEYPELKWIQMGYNAGFARANNQGIINSDADTVLLLNPDILLINNAIERTYQNFVEDEYIACGLQLLNSDGSPQISGNFIMKGALNNLLPLPYVGSLLKKAGNAFKVKKPNIPNTDTTVEVDWINGAFLMVKKYAINKAGLLDEDFFLYAEEAEWCSRLRKTGKLCIYGQYNVIHLQGETANATFDSSDKGYYNLYDRKGLQIMLSNFVRIRKEFGLGWFYFHLIIYTFSVPVFFIGNLLENILSLKNPFSRITLVHGFTKNIINLWKYVPIITKKKPFFYKVL